MDIQEVMKDRCDRDMKKGLFVAYGYTKERKPIFDKVYKNIMSKKESK